jgi:Ca-activated chloride channel family protein
MPFKEDTCRDIARIGGGIFFRAVDTKGMQSIFSEIDRLEKTEIEVQQYQNYEDGFGWFLGVSLAFLGSIFVLRETVWSRVP